MSEYELSVTEGEFWITLQLQKGEFTISWLMYRELLDETAEVIARVEDETWMALSELVDEAEKNVSPFRSMAINEGEFFVEVSTC